MANSVCIHIRILWSYDVTVLPAFIVDISNDFFVKFAAMLVLWAAAMLEKLADWHISITCLG